MSDTEWKLAEKLASIRVRSTRPGIGPPTRRQMKSGSEAPSICMTWLRIICAVALVKCFCEDMTYRTAVTANTTRPNTLK
jgi:hypothetical protein